MSDLFTSELKTSTRLLWRWIILIFLVPINLEMFYGVFGWSKDLTKNIFRTTRWLGKLSNDKWPKDFYNNSVFDRLNIKISQIKKSSSYTDMYVSIYKRSSYIKVVCLNNLRLYIFQMNLVSYWADFVLNYHKILCIWDKNRFKRSCFVIL